MRALRIPDNIAWVCQDQGPTVYALRLPDDVPRVFDGAGAFVFLDIADGLDPLAEALVRWPDDAEAVGSAIPVFVEELRAEGFITSGDEPPRPAPSPSPSPRPRATVAPPQPE